VEGREKHSDQRRDLTGINPAFIVKERPPMPVPPNYVTQDGDVTNPNDGAKLSPSAPTAPPDDQQKAQDSRAKEAPTGGESTRQAYNVSVPYSGTSLTFGSASGGAGASLVTLGQVLVDAVATMTLQSKGAFLAQTNSGMQWLADAGIKAHTPKGVEIIAGGGSAPGPCGCGGPATPGGRVDPTSAAQDLVNQVTMGTSLAKTAFDGTSAIADLSDKKDVVANIATLVKAAADATKTIKGISHDDETKKSGARAEVGAGIAGVVSGIAKGDFGSVASGISSVVGGGGTLATSAAKTDIKEFAANDIKMVANNKISGTAMNAIDFKTANKFTVVAGLFADFTTITHSSFTVMKWEAKSAKVKMSCKNMEWKSKVFGVIACGSTLKTSGTNVTVIAPLIRVDSIQKTKITGPTTIKDTLTVDRDTSIHGVLATRKATTLTGNLTVSNTATLNDHLEVKEAVTLKASLVVEGDFRGKSKFRVTGRCTLGGGL
jgi:hypothetical protein